MEAGQSLLPFIRYTKDDYVESWHHALLCRAVEEWDAGTAPPLLLVMMPPRSGKSEVVSRRLPAWLLGRNPDLTVMACSYAATLANLMCRDVQRVMSSRAYSRVFPASPIGIDPASGAKAPRTNDYFEVAGRSGSYRCAGVGGSITGMGFDRGIIDDPVKSAADARSATHRESVYEWFRSDFWTRRHPGAKILMTLTRWHHDDLAGRLLKLAEEGGERWRVVCLPALATDTRDPGDPRPQGGPLWPDNALFTREALDAARTQLGPYVFESLYQQQPTPREGGLFTLAGLSHFIDAIPVDVAARCRYWDKGYSSEGDWTAGVRMSRLPGGKFVIEDVVRFRASPEERNRIIKATAEADDTFSSRHVPPTPGSSIRRVPQLIERPPGAGAETTAALVRLLAGHSVRAVAPKGDKAERAEPLAAQCGAGNVLLARAPWNRAFIDELCVFPHGENDDQLDGASGSFNHLATKGTIGIM